MAELDYDLFIELTNNILSNISGDQQATGFHAVHCPICKNDRVTGGFKFEHDAVIYNCFRGSCDSNCVYTFGEPVSRKFRTLMDSTGAEIPLELKMVRSNLAKTIAKRLDGSKYEKHVYEQIKQPDEVIPITEAPKSVQDKWKKYFDDRGIMMDGVYYVTDGEFKDLPAMEMRYYDKLIGYVAVTGRKKGSKYINIYCESDNPLYIPGGEPPKDDVIIVEGAMDAKSFPNTAATMKSTFTPQQAYQLRECKRFLFLPDRTSNNFMKAFTLYKDRAGIIIPPWPEKDLAAAVKRYGIMEVANVIMNNIYDDPLKAQVAYDLWRQEGDDD